MVTPLLSSLAVTVGSFLLDPVLAVVPHTGTVAASLRRPGMGSHTADHLVALVGLLARLTTTSTLTPSHTMTMIRCRTEAVVAVVMTPINITGTVGSRHRSHGLQSLT